MHVVGRRLAALVGVAMLGAGTVAATGQQAPAEGCLTTPVATVVDLAVDPDRDDRVWVTDGSSIQRSDDAGCTWTPVYDVGEGLLGGEPSIVELATPTGDADWLSALVLSPSPTLPGNVVPMIATTRDAGGEWIEITEGLPENIAMDLPVACDRDCGLVGTTDGDETMYLWFTEPAGVHVYWTLSGGRVWTIRSEPSRALNLDVRTQDPADEMVVDDPGYFGLFGTREDVGALASDDGGRTWNDWPEHFRDFQGSSFGFPDEAVGAGADRSVDRLLVAELDPATGTLLATHAKYTDVLGWFRAEATGITGRVTDLTSIGDASLIAVTTTDGLFIGEQVTLDEVVWRPLAGLPGDARSLQSSGGRLWAHDGEAIHSLDPGVLPRLLDLPPVPIAPADLDLPPFDPANPYEPLPGTFTVGAADHVVEVAPGQTVDVPVELLVPGGPPKVDLFFLVARHESMADDLEALRREFFFIIKALQAEGVEVNVGIGVYGSQVRYHRYRDIGPPNDAFKKIVDDIYGFGAVAPAYTALDAALVGTIYPDTATMFATFKGIEAHWSPNATRILLHVTDAPPVTDEENRGEDGASIEQAHAAIVDTGVLHLGLVAGSTGTTLDRQGFGRMSDLSAVSGAFAQSPVDCNGDGVDDLQEGDPIVCFLPTGGTNPAVQDLGLLAGLTDVMVDLVGQATAIQPLAFHTTTPALVTFVAPTPTVDLLQDVALPATASVTCPTSLAGQMLPTRLSAVSGTRGLATTTLDIACGVLPVAPVVAAPDVVAPPVEPVPVQAAAPAPVPVPPAAAPVPVVNTPASSNIIPNQGIASAEQREQQAQAAHIGKDTQREPDAEAEFAFTAVRRELSPAPTLALGGAMALGAAGALARRRQGVTVQRVNH